MSDPNQLTLRPPSPGAKHVCVIDPDSTFSILLDGFLSQECAGKVELVAVYDRIPDGAVKLPHADIVLFNPTLPEFRSVDGIARVQRLFGENVVLMARLRGDESEELLEDLQVSGVGIGVRRNDFEGIVKALGIELSGIIQPMRAEEPEPVIETILVDESVRPKRTSKISDTAITPLLPIETRVKQMVHVCVIADDDVFARTLGLVLMKDVGVAARVEGVFDVIPRVDELTGGVEARLVIFDPEADAFRCLSAAISELRVSAGGKAALVARTDHWKEVGNPLTLQLKKAGIQAGCGREDYAAYVQLVMRLRNGAPPSAIGN